jgi:hypothetical protein
MKKRVGMFLLVRIDPCDWSTDRLSDNLILHSEETTNRETLRGKRWPMSFDGDTAGNLQDMHGMKEV